MTVTVSSMAIIAGLLQTTGSLKRGEARQLELVGMTGEAEINATIASYVTAAAMTVDAESAAVGTA